MKTEKYIKLIYEKGSVVFRKVTSFNVCNKTNLLIVTFEDKSASAVDMMFLNACLGKLINIKDNVTEIKEVKTCDIIEDL